MLCLMQRSESSSTSRGFFRDNRTLRATGFLMAYAAANWYNIVMEMGDRISAGALANTNLQFQLLNAIVNKLKFNFSRAGSCRSEHVQLNLSARIKFELKWFI